MFQISVIGFAGSFISRNVPFAKRKISEWSGSNRRTIKFKGKLDAQIPKIINMVQWETNKKYLAWLYSCDTRDLKRITLRFKLQSFFPQLNGSLKLIYFLIRDDLYSLFLFHDFIFQRCLNIPRQPARRPKNYRNAAVVYDFEPEAHIVFTILMRFSRTNMIELQIHIRL